MPERLGLRIALGLAIAAALLAGLHAWLRGAAEVPAAVGPPEAAALRSPGVLEGLRGPGVWLVYLAAATAAVPESAAPVVVVAPDGALRLERPPPARAPACAADRWLAAAVVLPAADLAGLDPLGRAALLDVLAALGADRGVDPGLLTPVDFRCAPAELAALARWLR